MRRIQAHFELAAGKKSWEKAVFVSEIFYMDLVMQAVDCFNRASIHAFEVDTELEAISEALLGNIFLKGMKRPDKAKHHLLTSIRVASSLYPRSFSDFPWF
jgi:hypothetical protein